MIDIVFVCTGNICRSPMAEGIMRARWNALGYPDMRVTSMGTHGLDKRNASSHSVNICSDNEIDISKHRSRPLVTNELDNADYIFSMEKIHKEYIRVFFPRLNDRNFLLGAWPEIEKKKNNIRDPMGCSLRVYRQAFNVIDTHIKRIIPIILE